MRALPWQDGDAEVLQEAAALEKGLLAALGIEEFVVRQCYSLSDRLTPEQLVALSELHKAEFAQTILDDGTVALVKGEAGQVDAAYKIGQTAEIAHTQPGHNEVVPSAEDLALSALAGDQMTIHARGGTPTEVVSLTLTANEVIRLGGLLDPDDPTQVVEQRKQFVREMIQILDERGIELPDTLKGEADLAGIPY